MPENGVNNRSLRKIKELFPEEAKLHIRFSMDNLTLDGNVRNMQATIEALKAQDRGAA